MYRVSRPGRLLVGAALIAGSLSAHGADYVLDDQVVVGSAGVGEDGDKAADFDAVDPAIAAAPEHHRVLIAWSADDASVSAGDSDSLHIVNNEFEIFARVVNTSFLLTETSAFRVSVMGDDLESDTTSRARYGAHHPSVAWNPVANEFLVVWEADDDSAPLVDDEMEIFGQRISVDGELVGERFRISVMGDDTVSDPAVRTRYGARRPSVAVHPTTGHYLVVWEGDDDSAPLVDDEMEIFGRMLDSTAVPVDGQFRISFAGDDEETDAATRALTAASRPHVVNNGEAFFVAWQADDGQHGLADDENEIFLQRIEPAVDETCADTLCPVVPASVVRVSTMGVDGDADFDALQPALAANAGTGAVLVAWHGDTNDGGLVEGENEVFARLYAANPAPLGSQFRVSVMGTESQADSAKRAAFDATDPHVTWSDAEGRFLVAWRGDTDMEIEVPTGNGDETETYRMADDEFEVFARFVETDGTLPETQFRVSAQGRDDVEDATERAKSDADTPAVVASNGVFLPVWSGDSAVSTNVDDRFRIYMTRVAMTTTELVTSFPSGYDTPKVPDPMQLEVRVANEGDVVAMNAEVRVVMAREFPMTLGGCTSVVDGNICELGDIAPGDSATFSITLTTDHIELGDAQGTDLYLLTQADTALTNEATATRELFIGATLKVEGGSGSLDWFWLMLGVLAPVGLARRRLSRPVN